MELYLGTSQFFPQSEQTIRLLEIPIYHHEKIQHHELIEVRIYFSSGFCNRFLSLKIKYPGYLNWRTGLAQDVLKMSRISLDFKAFETFAILKLPDTYRLPVLVIIIGRQFLDTFESFSGLWRNNSNYKKILP